MNKKFSTKTIAQAAFLVAMSLVLTRFLSFMPVNYLRVGLGNLPLMLSGFLFGPMVGGVTGAASDILGVMINSFGAAPHPGILLSSTLWGVIPGIFVKLFRRKENNPYSKVNIAITVGICFIIISTILDTYWLSRLYGMKILVMLPIRTLSALINIPLQSYIIYNLIKSLRRYGG